MLMLLSSKAQGRGQALIKNSKRPPDFRFSNCHSPTQDCIVLNFLNAAVLPLKTIVEGVSYLFTVLSHIGNVIKDNRCVKWCFSTAFIVDTALSMILKFHFL